MRTLSLLSYPFFIQLVGYMFDCLSQIQTIRISGSSWYLYLSNQTFYGLTNVTMLDLSDGYISSSALKAWFSDRSVLPKLSYLNLSMNCVPLPLVFDQATIDSLSSRPLQLIDLSHNIYGLTFDFQNSSALCTTLNRLILHDTPITVKQLPSQCDSLQFVDLSGNQELALGVKRCMDSFFDFPINSFYCATVMHLDRLMTDARGYHISNCLVFLPMCSESIRELYFSDNFIPEFELLFGFGAIGEDLQYINLSHNNIKTINTEALAFIPTLKKVDLSFNKLSHMQDFKGTFEALFRWNLELSSIDMSYNGLSYLPDKTFESNSNLSEVHMSHNIFRQVSLNTSNLSSLAILDFRFNKIQYLDRQSMQRVDDLYKNHKHGDILGQGTKPLHILLEGNPFICSCEALEFLQWFVSSPIHNTSYVCQLDGKNIPVTHAAVHAAEEDCERPRRKRRTILLSTILPGFSLAAIATGLVILYKRYKRRLVQQRLDDRLRLIQEEQTGFKFTVFLSYCSLDAEFVVPHIRQPLEVGNPVLSHDYLQCHQLH